jgi:hypothetical protein
MTGTAKSEETLSVTFSLLCPTYNHEGYVRGFIESVLAQSEGDFELIFVDDASTDATASLIETVTDSRIRLIRHAYNQGINGALNTAFSHAQGDYLVFIASDDLLYPTHLEQMKALFEADTTLNVAYCSLNPIDAVGNPIENKTIQANLRRKERPKDALLQDLFLKGNALLSPGMTMRRPAAEAIFPLPFAVVQHQDYLMHVRLLLQEGNVHCEPTRLVQYRIHDSISKPSPAVNRRLDLEEPWVMNAFLSISLDAFQAYLQPLLPETLVETYGEPSQETLPFFLGMLALQSKHPEKQAWGYRLVGDFLGTAEASRLKTSFTFKDYRNLVLDMLNPVDRIRTKLKVARRWLYLMMGIVALLILTLLRIILK